MTLSVSVIIPTYNRAEWVQRAIDSALHQTVVPDEIIVVDDGSTDQTPAILDRYAEPVRVIQQANAGRSAARNRGMSAARGDVIAFLDSDDYLAPASIERRAAVLKHNPQVGLVYTDVCLVDRLGGERALFSQIYPVSFPSGMVLAELAQRCFIVLSSVMVRRSVMQKYDLAFDESLDLAEDYDLWLRLAAKAPIAYIKAPLAYYRMVENVDFSVANWGLPSASYYDVAGEQTPQIRVQRRVFTTPEFRALNGTARARIYDSHGMRTMLAGQTGAARRYFWQAIRAAPLHPAGYVLAAISLLGRRAFEAVIVQRRRVVRWTARLKGS